MITVTMRSDSYERYRGFTITGHANHQEGKDGYDLVCSAVSAITLTCAFGLRDILHIAGRYESESGYMQVDIGDKSNKETELLMRTMLHGLEMIRVQYPDAIRLTHVKG